MGADRTLDELRAEFGRDRLLSMPIAGAVAWSAAGVLGLVLQHDEARSNARFLCMPMVFPLAFVVGRRMGEDVFGGEGQNELGRLFMLSILMANRVWAIAIPFWLIEPSSLPLGAGILSGLMWAIRSRREMPPQPRTADEFDTSAFIALAAAFSPNPARPELFVDLPYELRDGRQVGNDAVIAKWRAKMPREHDPSRIETRVFRLFREWLKTQ